jgi:hypothetical protein
MDDYLAGVALTGLLEHDSVPWEALPGQMGVDADGGVAPQGATLAAGGELHPPGRAAGRALSAPIIA